jgi:hypothetical protein
MLSKCSGRALDKLLLLELETWMEMEILCGTMAVV